MFSKEKASPPCGDSAYPGYPTFDEEVPATPTRSAALASIFAASRDLPSRSHIMQEISMDTHESGASDTPAPSRGRVMEEISIATAPSRGKVMKEIQAAPREAPASRGAVLKEVQVASREDVCEVPSRGTVMREVKAAGGDGGRTQGGVAYGWAWWWVGHGHGGRNKCHKEEIQAAACCLGVLLVSLLALVLVAVCAHFAPVAHKTSHHLAGHFTVVHHAAPSAPALPPPPQHPAPPVHKQTNHQGDKKMEAIPPIPPMHPAVGQPVPVPVPPRQDLPPSAPACTDTASGKCDRINFSEQAHHHHSAAMPPPSAPQQEPEAEPEPEQAEQQSAPGGADIAYSVEMEAMGRLARAGHVYEISYASDVTRKTHRIFIDEKDTKELTSVVVDTQDVPLSQYDKAMLAQQGQKLDAALAETEKRIKADPRYLENNETDKRNYASAVLNFDAIAKAVGSGGFNKMRVDETAVVRASQQGHKDIVVMVWPQEALKLSSLVRAARAGQVYELSYVSDVTHKTHRIFMTDKDMNNMRGVVANDRQGSLRQSDTAMLAQQAQKLDAALDETERAIQKNKNYLTNDENKKGQYATMDGWS
ncbi:unnamed protein product [Vitrella brassicaformis CCMP3155]|uniref:Uncharacterized protein n=1 Tax=Vitrella brassicaformis (strain CCMP3155) TaxID=1169540 RepID=A0A0G4FY95_VITBC|nr:unnamed protein product [Vitrella brassicaformis CCMP3155]|eukprot:CEM20417.1 unnamed protein product [Vitrella brassicaformis CCMP3155]